MLNVVLACFAQTLADARGLLPALCGIVEFCLNNSGLSLRM